MDKKPFSLLEYLSKFSQNEEYIVFEKREILNNLTELSNESYEELEQLVRYLEAKKFINIRLMDSKNIVLKMTSEGKTFARLDGKRLKNDIMEAQAGTTPRKIWARAFWWAFCGALLGGAVGTAIVFFITQYLL